jgi:hypothetical protein
MEHPLITFKRRLAFLKKMIANFDSAYDKGIRDRSDPELLVRHRVVESQTLHNLRLVVPAKQFAIYDGGARPGIMLPLISG